MVLEHKVACVAIRKKDKKVFFIEMFVPVNGRPLSFGFLPIGHNAEHKTVSFDGLCNEFDFENNVTKKIVSVLLSELESK